MLRVRHSLNPAQVLTGLAVTVLAVVCAVLAMGVFTPVAGAKQTPKTVSQCKKTFKHNAKARKACIARVKHKAKPSKCTLKVERAPQGDLGNTKEVSVQLKKLSGPTESWDGATIAAVVKVTNPRIEICSAIVSEAIFTSPSTPAETKEFHVTVGSHGGQSSPVTLSEKMWFVTAQVTARKK